MANKGGWLRYRCRMCSEEYGVVHVPDIGSAVSAVIFNHPNPWPLGMPLPKIIEWHFHKDDKSRGVADFIGGVVDDEDGK